MQEAISGAFMHNHPLRSEGFIMGALCILLVWLELLLKPSLLADKRQR